jgi:LmbE family N-acetylglucosaminyl deacetylase
VLVAHPDDETLWAGGTILSHPSWNWYIVSLCRASDPDRAPRFYQALHELGAAGTMGDLDDGPEQTPLDTLLVQRIILGLLPPGRPDLLITHDPGGEYTRHRRHEETARAAIALWDTGRLAADELWTFAYEDGGRQYLPRPVGSAAIHMALPEPVWQHKFAIITRTYGFPEDGFEARTTPRSEAFWRFTQRAEAARWAEQGGGRA